MAAAGLVRTLLWLAAAALLDTTSVVVPEPCTRSLSQYGEEPTMVNLFFQNKTGGVFVEIGALDGLKFSNTFYLETCLNWTGRLIEGSRKNFETLRENLQYRPRAQAVHSAVCVPPQRWVNFTVDARAVSADVDVMSPSFRRLWHSHNVAVEQVPCAPMGTLLAGLPHVDFWSLDVEGSELLAVTTVDWAAIQVDVILVELDYHNPQKNYQVRSVLRGAGYVECRWRAVRGNNALFLSRLAPYNCDRVGLQPCLCSYADCRCDGSVLRWRRHRTGLYTGHGLRPTPLENLPTTRARQIGDP
eukprot:EG_transcript_18415